MKCKTCGQSIVKKRLIDAFPPHGQIIEPKELIASLEITPSAVYKRLERAIDAGLIQRVKHGFYTRL